jgi:hypothetical protein
MSRVAAGRMRGAQWFSLGEQDATLLPGAAPALVVWDDTAMGTGKWRCPVGMLYRLCGAWGRRGCTNRWYRVGRDR